MSTQLDEGFEKQPTVVFDTVGDSLVLMIADKKSVPDYEFGTKTQKVDPKTGKGKEQDLITGIVLEGTTAKVRTPEKVERAAVVGEVVSVFLGGAMRFKFYEAKNKLGALNVSDVLGVRFDGTEDTGKGNPLKLYKVGLRRAKGDEASLAERAEVEHRKLNGTVIEEPSAPAGPSADASDDDFFG